MDTEEAHCVKSRAQPKMRCPRLSHGGVQRDVSLALGVVVVGRIVILVFHHRSVKCDDFVDHGTRDRAHEACNQNFELGGGAACFEVREVSPFRPLAV